MTLRAKMVITQVCHISNCKLSVQSKLGAQWSAQLGYSNIHRLFVQCPIYNGTGLIWSKMWKKLSFFWVEKCLFYWVSTLLHFRWEPENESKQFKKQKHWYLIHTWSDKGFKGTVVNWAFWINFSTENNPSSLPHYNYSALHHTKNWIDTTYRPLEHDLYITINKSI